ncbi:MAG: radical SAM/SPASM domain-containing protein [Planctomycetota bacterium]
MSPEAKHLRAIQRPNVGQGERELLEHLHAPVPSDDALNRIPSFPWKLQVQTFSRCNAACSMCPWPQTKKELDQGRMKESTFRALLEQCRGNGLERMSLFLHNEPLLDVRLAAWTRMAREALPHTELTLYTNGWLLTPDKALELAEAGIDEINVSVLAADEALVEEYSPGTPLAKILGYLETMSLWMERGQFPDLRLSVAALDLPGVAASFAPFEDRWKGRGLPIYYAPVSNRAGNCDWGEGAGATRVVCQRPFTKAYVLYDGRLVLCNCDWRREEVLGNIRETPLQELWQGPAYQEMRAKLLRQDLDPDFLCTACDYPYRVAEEVAQEISV